jgi:hypothetical protein
VVSIVFGVGVLVVADGVLVMYTIGVGVDVITDGVLVMYTIGVGVDVGIVVFTDGVLIEEDGVLVMYTIGMDVFTGNVFVEAGNVDCIFAGGVVNIFDIFLCICLLLYSTQIQY